MTYRVCPIELGDTYFAQFLNWTHQIEAQALHCLACLLSFDEQPGWAELWCQLGVSNLEKNHIFGILIKNCLRYVSAIKIRHVAGTPNVVNHETVAYTKCTMKCTLCHNVECNNATMMM